MGQKISPRLADVPETMLWTLHSRASEAKRSDGVLDDPKAVEIYDSIDYDYRRNFGAAEPTLALRATVFDQVLRRFLKAHPDACIVNLGEGLETQRYRVDAPAALWVSVDLPEAMAVREQFIRPNGRHRHIACSATDTRWFREIPRGRPVFVSAQGLFMYLERAAVRRLLRQIVERLPGSTLVFDVIPKWVSQASIIAGGLPRTAWYRTPVMPWGVDRIAVRPLLRYWLGSAVDIRVLDLPPFPRGMLRMASRLVSVLPPTRLLAPCIVELQVAHS
jgi:O-methyltransferase involved in polyketide biosynthesis